MVQVSLKKYRHETEITNKLKIIKELIENEWRFEISTIANNNLQQKSGTNLHLFRGPQFIKDLYLEGRRKMYIYTAIKYMSYRTLVEIIHIQLLLLNRRRVGELQRMTVNTYTTNSNSNEFDSERFLMKLFRRVVVKEKRGRGVSVSSQKKW